jgi:hypothetical protein
MLQPFSFDGSYITVITLPSFLFLQNSTGYVHLKGGSSLICPLRSGSLLRLTASHANNISLSHLKIPITMIVISHLGYIEVVRSRGARLSSQIFEARDFLQVFDGMRFGFDSWQFGSISLKEEHNT